jgi:Protein of unknown function (DUF2793)
MGIIWLYPPPRGSAYHSAIDHERSDAMEETANLKLPFIMPSQAQKHVTHNEALAILDAVVQLSVLDCDLTFPPGIPGEGDRHIVAAGSTDAWAGHDGEIAAWQDGGWIFLAPRPGWLAWVRDEGALYCFEGPDWAPAERSVNPAPLVGVNATADQTNRLAVKSPASLFDHEGAGHQLQINKQASTATATLLFQIDYSGRAELGLAGSDDLAVKVSPDGSSWKESMIADRETGAARFPAGIEHALTRRPLKGLVFTPGGDGQVSIYRNDTARVENPRQAVLAMVSGDLLTLTSNAASLFFHDFMRGVSFVRIWNVTKSPQQSAWVKWNSAANQLQVTHAAHVASWSTGETIQIGDPLGVVPTRAFALDISPMLQAVLGTVFRQSGLLLKTGVAGNGGRTIVSVSEAGAGGSFLSTCSFDTGNLNTGMLVVPSSVPSPVSNSNLLFVREEGATTGALGLTMLSVSGVLA